MKMTERIQTIINLIEEVASTLRDTRNTDVDSVRLISKENVELSIQKLNSVLELVKQDDGYKAIEFDVLLKKLREALVQVNLNKRAYPERIKWPDPMDPYNNRLILGPDPYHYNKHNLGPAYAGTTEGLI